jgi:hypothetical protein
MRHTRSGVLVDSPCRILVVASDPDLTDRLRDGLRGAGYRVVPAASLTEAAACAAALLFDLVLAAAPPHRWGALAGLRALAEPAPLVVCAAGGGDYRAPGFADLLPLVPATSLIRFHLSMNPACKCPVRRRMR